MSEEIFLNGSVISMKNKIYFTISYQCDQDIKDSPSIADYVFKRFLKDFPSVNELFGKCDNAGCYYGNPYPELLYHISQQNRFFLKRLDYREPQKGDSALARNALRTYVEEGNSIVNPGDRVNAFKSSINKKCLFQK